MVADLSRFELESEAPEASVLSKLHYRPSGRATRGRLLKAPRGHRDGMARRFNMKLYVFYSVTIVVNAPAKRVGNSLAVFLPAAKVREAGIKEGDILNVRIEIESLEPLGLGKRLGFDFSGYSRREDDATHDRF